TPPGGQIGALSSTTYSGFALSEKNGRRIVTTQFTDPVALDSAPSAVGRTATALIDALGRVQQKQLNLGSKYSNQIMVTGYTTFDLQGRAMFEADPYGLGQDPKGSYGTTHLFNADGTPSCTIRGTGVQAATQTTDEQNEIYPTCFTRSYAG